MRLLFYALAIFCFSTSLVAQTNSSIFVRKNVEIPAFYKLHILGPVNIFINTSKLSPSTPYLQIFGDSKTVSAVTWEVRNNTLYLGTKWYYRPQRGDYLTIKLNVTPSQLKKICFNSNGSLLGEGLAGSLSLKSSGNGSIKLYNNGLNLKSLQIQGKTHIELFDVNSKNLIVKGENDGEIKIEGKVGLHTINLIGNGVLKIDLIHSPALKIVASNSEKIFLKGVAETLDVQLSQQSQLLAKKLLAINGYIETQNQARAEITIEKKLNALAKNNSIIYYSKNVDTANLFTQNLGLILVQ